MRTIIWMTFKLTFRWKQLTPLAAAEDLVYVVINSHLTSSFGHSRTFSWNSSLACDLLHKKHCRTGTDCSMSSLLGLYSSRQQKGKNMAPAGIVTLPLLYVKNGRGTTGLWQKHGGMVSFQCTISRVWVYCPRHPWGGLVDCSLYLYALWSITGIETYGTPCSSSYIDEHPLIFWYHCCLSRLYYWHWNNTCIMGYNLSFKRDIPSLSSFTSCVTLIQL